jgi:hypothetical protein
VRLDAHAAWMCVPTEHPGKVWIRTTQPRAFTFDPATRAIADTPRPASCRRGRAERDCWIDNP